MTEGEKPEKVKNNKPVSTGKEQPSFDELPPRGFEELVKKQKEQISEETGISVEDIDRYEKMAEEESES